MKVAKWRELKYIIPCVVIAIAVNMSRFDKLSLYQDIFNVLRFWEIEIKERCWDYTKCGCGDDTW